MLQLQQTMQRLLGTKDTRFVRYLYRQINWDGHLIAILGARGVGKSTMLLQHILLTGKENTLYVTADDFYFSQHRLFDLALEFYQQGGKRLLIDEIHKYHGWSTEIKNIYDQIPQLQIIYTGSSILDLERGGADLSRRKSEYHLAPLSFREWLIMKHGWSLDAYSLDDVLRGNAVWHHQEERPIALFQEYLRRGNFPFGLEPDFDLHIQGVIKQVVENDIPDYADMNVASATNLKKLMYVLSQSVPFKPNFSALERDLGINRNTLAQYLEYLDKAQLINVLRTNANGIKVLQKIDKVYLNNPNFAYALTENPNIGNIRETVFLMWLQVGHIVTGSPVSDFEVDGITFEVGGKNKGSKQLKGVERGYIVRDDIEYATGNIIPLWMFGLMY